MSIACKPKKIKALEEISDVVWLQTSFIGDIILTTSAISALAKAAPWIRQHMITTSVGAAALAEHPLLSSIHEFKKRSGLFTPFTAVKKSIKALNLRNTVTLQPHKSLRSTLLAKFLGFPIVTYEETSLSLLANVKIPRIAVFHEANRISLLLEGIGVTRNTLLNNPLTLQAKPLPGPAGALAESTFNWIAIAPGSVWPTKRWPVAKFIQLTKKLLERQNTAVILLGGRDDIDTCNLIEGSCQLTTSTAATRLLNLAGKTSLQDLLGIYPKIKLLVSNDSSPIHYASAFQVPTIAIFGSTVPAMGFSPLAVGSKIAEIDLSCRPCGTHGHKRCPLGHFRCMEDISVDHVLKLID